jgi:hypothetical protein
VQRAVQEVQNSLSYHNECSRNVWIFRMNYPSTPLGMTIMKTFWTASYSGPIT